MFDTDAAFDLLPAEPSRVPVVDQVAGGLVGDLDWLPTGIMLAAALDRVDRKQLSHHDQVSLAKARARQIAHDQAELLADIEAIAEGVSAETAEQIDDPMMRDHVVFDTTAAEISAALSLTRRMSEIQTELAH